MFYPFIQNNSGGHFCINEKVSELVVIEALSADSANIIAEKEIGIYFDGVKKEKDCPCCGSRWYRTRESEGYRSPEELLSFFNYKPEEARIHYLDYSALK